MVLAKVPSCPNGLNARSVQLKRGYRSAMLVSSPGTNMTVLLMSALIRLYPAPATLLNIAVFHGMIHRNSAGFYGIGGGSQSVRVSHHTRDVSPCMLLAFLS